VFGIDHRFGPQCRSAGWSLQDPDRNVPDSAVNKAQTPPLHVRREPFVTLRSSCRNCWLKEGLVAQFFRGLGALGKRIALTQRHVGSLQDRIERHPIDSAEARYARTVLHVLRRSLKTMITERIRIEHKLQEQVRRERQAAPRKAKLFANHGEDARPR